jgi:hypothetical protein
MHRTGRLQNASDPQLYWMEWVCTFREECAVRLWQKHLRLSN